MLTTVMHGAGDVRIETVPGAGDVRIETVPDAGLIEPTDSLIRVTCACICGSDLWQYKTMEHSETGRQMGHEAIGVIAAVGTDVRTMKAGDLVVMPFAYSDGTCVFCHEGVHTSCIHGGFFGTGGEAGGAQAEALRVPQADGTLFVLPVGEDDALMPSLLTLSDVMGTGHHGAVAAKVARGKTVAVVGDGAVGLCGVIAAKRLGAEQIIILGRHPDRIALAKQFGATEVVSERGDEAVERVRELTDGYGAHSVLECVGLGQSTLTAISIARPGGAVGRVGVPQDERMPASQPAFYGNVTVSGGPAPVRAYIEKLLPDVLEGRIEPGRVFDRTVSLDELPDGYRGNERPRSDQGHGDAMTAWTPDELDPIGAAEELELSALRGDGTPRRPLTIWVVRHGDDLYVRSWRGPTGGWFRAAHARGEGHISAGGVEKDVEFVDANDDVNDPIDAAYRTKYRRYADSYVTPMVSEPAPVTWGEHVTDEEYNAAPATDK